MKHKYRKTLAGATLGLALFSWGCQQSTPGTTATTNVSTSNQTQMAQESPASTPMHHEMEMGEKGVETLKSLEGKEFDIAFLSQMIAHHQAAVNMANDALKVATRPETKEEAQKLIDDQTEEIRQMTAWLKDWYGTEPSSEQQAIMKQDMQGMMAMQIKDDHAFYDMMIPHHEGAIDMSELADSRAARSEVKDLARQIISEQQAEIQRYETLADKDH